MTTGLRVKLFRIHGDIFASMFTKGNHFYQVVDNALPADARIVGVKHDIAKPTEFVLLVESDEFPEVKPGAWADEINPHLRRVYFPALSGDQWRELLTEQPA